MPGVRTQPWVGREEGGMQGGAFKKPREEDEHHYIPLAFRCLSREDEECVSELLY